ncbi:NAD-specific glutamate dehydrogenase [Hysterangium stoloniferum]|nr:NAD-specific glutamate dehydrogenase [Hysterangium stoloniferum]
MTNGDGGLKPSLTPDLSRVGTPSSDTSVHKVKNVPGYMTPTFLGKNDQRARVQEIVAAKGFIARELVKNEVIWFYDNLGIDDTYFATQNPDNISDHILALYAAKVLAYTKHDPDQLVIDLERITKPGDESAGRPEGAFFIHTSPPGVSSTEGPGATCERRIDQIFLDNSTPSQAYRLETYRSTGAVSARSSQQLRCYFVARCSFPTPPPASILNEEGLMDIKKVSDLSFLEKVSANTLEIYENVMRNVETRHGPVIEVFEVENTRERRIVIGYKMGGTSHFFSALSDLYHYYQLYSARKYVEQFSNGITIISLYLNPLPNSTGPPIEECIFQIVKEISLLFCLPDNPFFRTGPEDQGAGHAVQEATYAYCGSIFAQHFCNRLGPAYISLKNVLDETNPAHAEVLNEIKKRFREETFTRESILNVVKAYPELVSLLRIRMLYVHFAMTHYPTMDESMSMMPTLSYQRLRTEVPLSDEELFVKIKKTTQSKHDAQVMESFLIFNKHVLKTNFYQPTKVALSFRLAPDFLPDIEYPKKPFGIFFVIGSEFRGFHIRFKDVARGGIRIVMSKGREMYSINQRMLFDENYALASTQSLKNKDIPEGGSKGTILPSLGASPRLCFEKYVDAMIDLLIPGTTPGIKNPIVDLYAKPELLFFGPDEGTAEMMDWAALHARTRGATTWWKSFTTGKSASKLGGVPHDVYGMTSLSVRQYVLGIYKHLGLREKDVTKLQTGGPDGDLGSNEILLSSDKTIAVIDGSGVLADPLGINRVELVRLAKLRVPVSHFDTSKLGKDGYLVKVEDQDVKLPSGEIVADGTDFRNSAHLRFKADIFVPCGGRPEAVNISNVGALVDHEGKPHFKYIVEGANLFFSQQARLFLEKRKVVLYKDSSANKGGVTCSSLDVLAGLSLDDTAFFDLMTFKDGKPTEFYNNYVKDIQQKITENAAAEFNCIHKEHARLKGSKPRTIISDELSLTITELQDKLEQSDLFDDVPSRRGVLSKAIPQTLLKKVGLDELMHRLPEQYQRALFASWVASHFIYKYGVVASNVDFYHFIRDLSVQQK